MHNLSLIFPATSSCDKLTVQDGSCYDINFPVTNTILEIKPPGAECFIIFNLPFGWCSKTINCQDLEVCCKPNGCSPLPDGNYEIKYSVDPNLATMVEYNHFRVCILWTSYINSVCELRGKKCDYSKSEYKARLDDLYNIRNMILDAVILAEECLNVDGATELYNEAKKLLTDGHCQTCM